MIKKLTACLFAAATFFALFSPAHADIRVGIMNEAYPPFFTKDATGTWQGFEIDVLHAVCEEMKEKCTFVDLAWDGLIPGLLSKKFDIIWSGMSITEERKKTIIFSNRYYQVPSKLIGEKNGHLGTTPEDVKGKIIGIQVATIQSNYYKKYYADVAEEQTYSTLDGAFQDLAAGRIDYVFGSSVPLMNFVHTDQGQFCCEDKGDVKFDAEILGAGCAAGLRKEDTELRDRINVALDTILKNGTYDALAKKYFDFDPYGQRN